MNRYLFLGVMGGALTACTPPMESPLVLRADSAGVEIVTSPAEDRPLPWELRPRFSLGGAEEGPEAFYFVAPSTVGVDGSGGIYVLDGAAHRVVVFSREGAHLRTLGGAGSGPGEFSSPGTLAVSPDGTLHVFDFGKGGLVRFGPSGELLPELPFRFFPWPGPSRHIGAAGEGMLVASMAPPPNEESFRHALQRVTPSDTLTLAEHVFPRPGMVRYESCGGGLNLPRIFEPQLLWESRGDRVLVAPGAHYEVALLEGGREVRRLRRDLPLRPASERAAVAELGEGFTINFGRGPCTIPPGEMVSGRGFAPTIPWIAGVALAPGGEVWVERLEVGGDRGGPVDVFDPSGGYLGTLPPGTPFPFAFLDDERYLTSERDELGVMRLVVLGIDRGG